MSANKKNLRKNQSLKLEALEPRLLMATDLVQALDAQLEQYDTASSWQTVTSVS